MKYSDLFEARIKWYKSSGFPFEPKPYPMPEDFGYTDEEIEEYLQMMNRPDYKQPRLRIREAFFVEFDKSLGEFEFLMENHNSDSVMRKFVPIEQSEELAKFLLHTIESLK